MFTTESSLVTQNNEDYDYYSSTMPCDTNPGLVQGSYQMIVLYLVFCLGLTGNVAVLWVLIRYIKLKSMTDVCLLNLALSDLVVVLTLPLWASLQQQYSGDGLCKVMSGAYQLGLYSGTLFVTLMSVDRYLAIVHAVAAMRARTLRYGTAASVIIWALSVAAALPQVVFAQLTEDEDGTFSCQTHYPEDAATSWKMYRNFAENAVSLFVCLPVMVYCYVCILVVLQRSRNSKKDRAMKLILGIVCMFVICWVPYNVAVFFLTLQMFNIVNSCEMSARVNAVLQVTEIIALTHCCVNPVIYAFVGEKFRNRLRLVLSKNLFCKHVVRNTRTQSRGSENETSNTPV
ncbi:C-C chemokine receptor type 1 [Hypomesus transpacificus]|uniref:C-C chemokine receptor type 1 n=1 Tax=Hypomesus transpacificus TaxID=137520 RepID=UPI001F085C4A|nr:C-C chemokine receptor type 1 [Hypomesus transpacificus]